MKKPDSGVQSEIGPFYFGNGWIAPVAPEARSFKLGKISHCNP